MIQRHALPTMALVLIVTAACSAGAPATSGGRPSGPPSPTTAGTLTPTAAATTSVAPTPNPTPDVTPTAEPTPLPEPTPTPLATLTPTDAGPASNDEPPGTAIRALPFIDVVNVSRAQVHAMEIASPCGSGSQSVWYSYVATADGVLVADTAGSDYDTILDVWRGTLSADAQNPGFDTLVAVACNDNSPNSSQAGIVFEAVAGQAYAVRVSTALNDPGGNLRFSLTGR